MPARADLAPADRAKLSAILGRLGLWEANFLASMGRRPRPPTDKQTAVIDRLVRRRMAVEGVAL